MKYVRSSTAGVLVRLEGGGGCKIVVFSCLNMLKENELDVKSSHQKDKQLTLSIYVLVHLKATARHGEKNHLDWGVIQGQEFKYSSDLSTYRQSTFVLNCNDLQLGSWQWTHHCQTSTDFWETTEFSHGFNVQSATSPSCLNNSSCFSNNSSESCVWESE